jgi:hypothetical protein
MKQVLAAIALLAATPAWGQPAQVIPPEEYDHPYKGKVTIQVFSDQKLMREKCPYSPFPYLLGCARAAMEVCWIAIADEELLNKLKYPAEIIIRHERAHCNGWPQHHPGGKPLEVQKRQ